MTSEQTFRATAEPNQVFPSFTAHFCEARERWGGGVELGFRISKELVSAAAFAGEVFGVSDSTLHYSLNERKPDLEELESKRICL
jgi:signal transduction histidine kinase